MSDLKHAERAATPAAGLTFDQAPPLLVPFRFFLTAPVFLLFAALLLAFGADDIILSRWSPAALAVTHLLTLGFLAQIMAGALFQLLPVLGGTRVANAGLVALFVHAAINGGTLALAAGFLLQSAVWLRVAAVLLGSGWAVFLVAATIAAWLTSARSATLFAIRLALAALLANALLGLALLGALSGGFAVDLPRLVGLHSGWGLVGWIALLVIGVAYQVVPMFQLTPQYAGWLKRWLAPAAFALLCLWTLAAGSASVRSLAGMGIALLLLGFAGATLFLQTQKRRRMADVTVDFWQLGMASLAAAALVWIAGFMYPSLLREAVFPTLIAILFLLGFAASVVSGMLYKIVPFLVWFHLSSRQGVRGVPLMNAIVPAAWARCHFRLHLGAVAIALAAAISGSSAVLTAAAIPLAGAALTLGVAILRAYRVYLRHTPTS